MPNKEIIKVGTREYKISYGSNFNDPYIIQSILPFSWGHEIDYYNRKKDDLKGLNDSIVAVWHIKHRH